MMHELTARRNACNLCGERKPGRVFNGAHPRFAHIPGGNQHFSYWAQWLGDTNPNILIVGQDFGGTQYIEESGFVDDPQNQTNLELHRLLGIAGITVTVPPLEDLDSGVFLTNSILCIKSGLLAASILKSWINTCSDNMLGPLITRLRPRLVVALGASAWGSVRRHYTIPEAPAGLMNALNLETSWRAEDGTLIFCMGHCSQLGRRSRTKAQQEGDWRRLGIAYLSEPLKDRLR